MATDIEAVGVSAEQAIALGLIVNEFVTNSLKYAFEGGEGKIIIFAVTLDRHRLRLQLSDTGKGLAGGGGAAGTGTGMQIIKGLCRQLGTDPDWSSSGGTTLSIEVSISTSP